MKDYTSKLYTVHVTQCYYQMSLVQPLLT